MSQSETRAFKKKNNPSSLLMILLGKFIYSTSNLLFRQKHCSIYSNFDYCILFLLCKYQIKFSSVENIFHDLINSLDCKLFPSLYIHIDTEFSKYIYIQCVPRKGFGEFGSAVCVQRDRNIVYIVSLSADLADPNPFRDTHSIISSTFDKLISNAFKKSRILKYFLHLHNLSTKEKKHRFKTIEYVHAKTQEFFRVIWWFYL